MSYAVIVTGGKQYKVAEGEYLKVEKLDIATGETVTFDQVLLVGNGDDVKIGLPVVDGAKVTAEVTAQGRHDKVTIIKFRRGPIRPNLPAKWRPAPAPPWRIPWAAPAGPRGRSR